MPALITHYLHARDVFSQLENHESLNEDAFVLGAQGPDVLYYHRLLPVLMPGKSLRKTGVALHAVPANTLFSAFAAYCVVHPENRLALSYALGFLCHYSLDRIAHPYVYAMQADIIEKEHYRHHPYFIHVRIEHTLDIIMLRSKLGLTTDAFNPKQCITNDQTVLQGCAAILAAVLQTVGLAEGISPARLVRGYKDARFCQGLSHDPHLYKGILLKVLERLVFMRGTVSNLLHPLLEDGRWDYSNFEYSLWKNPFDPEAQAVSDSFFELFDRSGQDSAALCMQFLQTVGRGGPAVDFTGNYSMKTGLPEKDG